MDSKKGYWLTVITYIYMLTANTLANTLPINNKTTGELSNNYPNLFVPAGVTFSIWGIIYLSLLLLLVVSFPKLLKINYLEKNWKFIALNFFFNGTWIFFWHYEFVGISILLMLGLLITLILINLNTVLLPGKFAFGVYLGWICVALVANVTAWLVTIKWSKLGISEMNWTMIMILISGSIGAISIHKFKNPFIVIPIVWAFIGIYIKRTSVEVIFQPIIVSLYFGGLIVLLSLAFYFFGKKTLLES